jgi:putative ABC transport system substrate-binding protein
MISGATPSLTVTAVLAFVSLGLPDGVLGGHGSAGCRRRGRILSDCASPPCHFGVVRIEQLETDDNVEVCWVGERCRSPSARVSMMVYAQAVSFALAVSLLVSLPLAGARSQERLSRIGWLSIASSSAQFPEKHALESLRELGWVEGKNVAIEYRYAAGDPTRLAEFAAELVRLKVDLIVTSSAGVGAAKRATGTIPVVFGTSQDPVRMAYVTSLARPGGNLTGMTYLTDELSAKRLELLKDAIPSISRAAIMWEPAHLDNEYRGMQAVAAGLGIRLQSLEIPRPARPDEVETAIQAAVDGRAEALILAPGGFTIRHRKRIIALAAKSRLPVISAWSIFSDDGALLTYGPDLLEISRRIAVFVDKILKGAKPESLPVEVPSRFELVVNLKTARAVGLAIPRSLLLRADRLIE